MTIRSRDAGALALGLGLLLALPGAAHDVANVSLAAHPAVKNVAAASHGTPDATALLAEKIDALLRAPTLAPGFRVALANPAGTTELVVAAAGPQTKTVRLTDLKTRAVIGEWQVAAATPDELRAISDAVFQRMALSAPVHLKNKPVRRESKSRAH